MTKTVKAIDVNPGMTVRVMTGVGPVWKQVWDIRYDEEAMTATFICGNTAFGEFGPYALDADVEVLV